MFFSLSIAMGIMITYGSYMKQRDSLTSSAIRVAGFDVGVSFLAGLMIVPAAFVALGSPEAVTENSGPGLMFIVLPQMFSTFGDFAPVIGGLFFLLVLFAALTSAISLTETCVSIIHDGAKCSRKKAMAATFAIIAVAAVFVNLGYNGLSFIEPLGEGSSLLDLFDFVSNTVMMPIVALLTCIFVGWCIKPKIIEEEIMASAPFKARGAWRIMIKFIAPILIVIVFISFIAQFLGFMTI
jgi:NSS family neurotransmitter:Na+ symporter